MNACCPFDGAKMGQQPGYWSVCGPDAFGTFFEFVCPKCNHEMWYGGLSEKDWATLKECDCCFCTES